MLCRCTCSKLKTSENGTLCYVVATLASRLITTKHEGPVAHPLLATVKIVSIYFPLKMICDNGSFFLFFFLFFKKEVSADGMAQMIKVCLVNTCCKAPSPSLPEGQASTVRPFTHVQRQHWGSACAVWTQHTDLQLWLSTVNYSPGRYSRVTWNSATFLKPHFHLWVGRDSCFACLFCCCFAVRQLNVKKRTSH